MLILEQKRRRLGIILLRSDVKCWKSDFSLGVVLQKHGNNTVMALLKGHCERREAVFSGECLVGSVIQEVSNDVFVVFLSGHVERGEAVDGLDIDIGAVLDEDRYDEGLTGKGGDVEGGVSFLKLG